MAQGFLEQESQREHKRFRKIFMIMFLVFICLVAFLCLALKDSFDISDERDQKLFICLIIFIVIMVVSVITIFFRTRRAAANGKNLILPFNENTKEAVGRIIDQEVLEGKVQVEEYMYEFSEGEKPYGQRVILIPSYLLLCTGGIGNVIAIPRDKIYWICAQVGRKGSSSFIVRLLIFTEKKTFDLEGVDVRHVESIAAELYQYIPNVFSGYDPFILSYELEKLFDKNRGEFLKFYEEGKKNMEG